MEQKVNIIVVDDHPIVLEGIKLLLADKNNLKIIACFEKGSGVLDYLKDNQPHIILLDISLSDTNGILLCKQIKELYKTIHIIMISNHSERSIILQALKNGASGYLLKNAKKEEFIVCIEEVLKGNIFFSKEVNQIMNKQVSKETNIIPRLTKREKEILKLLIQGKTSINIAELLFLSPFTVDTQRKNIIQKFSANNITEVVAKTHQFFIKENEMY